MITRRSALNVLYVAALVSSLALSSPAQAGTSVWGQEVRQFIQKHGVKRNGLTYLSLKTFGSGHQLDILGKIMEKSIGVGFNATYVGGGMPGHTEVYLGKMKSDFIGSRHANFYNMMDDTLHGLVVAVYASKTTEAIEAARASLKTFPGRSTPATSAPSKWRAGAQPWCPRGRINGRLSIPSGILSAGEWTAHWSKREDAVTWRPTRSTVLKSAPR